MADAWAAQEAEFDAEIVALDAAGECAPPDPEELCGLVPDTEAGPPDGADRWLSDLPGPLLDEYLAATTEPTEPEAPASGCRETSGGAGAGFAASGAGGGFAAGGLADRLPPGPALAGAAAAAHAAGLAWLSDDELAGLIRAGRRLASWASAVELAAVGDLMRRREEQEAAGQPHAAEHADAELAALLTLTGRGAGRVLDLAMALRRLPLTSRALAAGAIDLHRAAVIADETSALDDDHAAAVERHVVVRAPGQTTAQLRAAARRAVLAADPRAARKRQEAAQREARVERWDEQAGTAALAGRDLPPAGVLAADQHISTLARALRAAGLTGTADQVRARVFLALLSGQPATSLFPAGEAQPGVTAADRERSAGVPATSRPARSGPPAPAASDTGAAGPGAPSPGAPSAGAPSPGAPGLLKPTSDTSGAGASGPRTCATAASDAADWPAIPAVAGMVNLTMPLATWIGLLGSPGEVTGFGPLSAQDSRQLGMAMAAHPQTRWCMTLTSEDGRPVAHGCASKVRGLSGRAPPGPGNETDVAAWAAGIHTEWFESGECAHPRQSAAYRPPLTLQHLIRTRQRTCVFPGCRRPASQCDLDHTAPYQRGGRTCECNLAPLCRRHHEAKQAPGWHLEQSSPGVLTWTTPSGRARTTRPTGYPE